MEVGTGGAERTCGNHRPRGQKPGAYGGPDTVNERTDSRRCPVSEKGRLSRRGEETVDSRPAPMRRDRAGNFNSALLKGLMAHTA